MKDNTKAILLVLLCTVMVSIAQICLKLGSAAFAFSFDLIYNIPFLIGAGLYALGSIVFFYAFRLGELSVVYPIMALGYVIVSILSVFFLNEILTVQSWIGIIVITFGVIIIGRSGS